MQPQEPKDEDLERLLVDRWLYRGGILTLIAIVAILLTLLAGRGLASLAEQILAGVLVVSGILFGAVFFVMRQQDHALIRTLRKRRRNGS